MAEVKPFLDRVFASIGTTQATNAFERELLRVSRYPDYVLLLRRAWCFQEMAHLTAEEQAYRLGSKAENGARSSLLKHARAMHRLLVEYGLHSLLRDVQRRVLKYLECARRGKISANSSPTPVASSATGARTPRNASGGQTMRPKGGRWLGSSDPSLNEECFFFLPMVKVWQAREGGPDEA